MSNRDENRNCHHVHVRPVRKSQIFCSIPLPAIVVFYSCLSSMRCSEAERATETRWKCICVHIHPALESSRSEDSQLGPADGMTSDRSDNI